MEADLTTMEAAVRRALAIHEVDVQTYSPLVLAYIGDAVYELLIRTRVVSRGSMQVAKMHKKSAGLVKAETQAELIQVLMDELTEEERTVYKRGRNAKSGSMAKHATMADYRMATGFEALVGYLYLTSRYGRLLELVHEGLARIGELEADDADAGTDREVASAAAAAPHDTEKSE